MSLIHLMGSQKCAAWFWIMHESDLKPVHTENDNYKDNWKNNYTSILTNMTATFGLL